MFAEAYRSLSLVCDSDALDVVRFETKGEKLAGCDFHAFLHRFNQGIRVMFDPSILGQKCL